MLLPAAIALSSVSLVFTAHDPSPADIYCDEDGWYYHGGFCYLIDPANTTQMAWMDAVEFCPTASESESVPMA